MRIGLSLDLSRRSGPGAAVPATPMQLRARALRAAIATGGARQVMVIPPTITKGGAWAPSTINSAGVNTPSILPTNAKDLDLTCGGWVDAGGGLQQARYVMAASTALQSGGWASIQRFHHTGQKFDI